VAAHDGNGWVDCRCGRRHWGLHGAAGLVLLRPATAAVEVLMQLRAGWTHEGGSWGVPGGARDSHEDVVAAAVREASEEAGVRPEQIRVLTCRPGVDHQDWQYTYVIARVEAPMELGAVTAESEELRWVALPDVAGLLLHPALGRAWAGLHTDLTGLAMPSADPPA
jgi:8-oxo-dGTP diphosphatase